MRVRLCDCSDRVSAGSAVQRRWLWRGYCGGLRTAGWSGVPAGSQEPL